LNRSIRVKRGQSTKTAANRNGGAPVGAAAVYDDAASLRLRLSFLFAIVKHCNELPWAAC
jgi:hypothetical protein